MGLAVAADQWPETTPEGKPGELVDGEGGSGEPGMRSAVAPAGWVDGRNSGPFWPHAPSSEATTIAEASPNRSAAREELRSGASSTQAKTARGAWAQPAAKLDPGHSFISRILSTMSTTTLQDTEYQQAAERVLAAIERQTDDWLQQGVIDIDSSRSGGLVELEFPNGSKIVVNKQPPLHEIWLAARNGGFHFKFIDGLWRDTRDGVEFFARLSDEAGKQAGVPLRWTPPA